MTSDAVPRHASADLMHAYVARAAEIAATGGRIGLIASDRLLLNSSSGELRRRLGEQAFCRRPASTRMPNPRALSTQTTSGRLPARKVSDLGRSHNRSVDANSQPIHCVDDIETPTGESLDDLVNIELAPWLGPDGIFTAGSPTAFRSELLVLCRAANRCDR